MSSVMPKPAVLSDEELSKVRALEAKLGDNVVVVAYAKTLQPAKLKPTDLQRLKKVEQELKHVYLVAWSKPSPPAAGPVRRRRTK